MRAAFCRAVTRITDGTKPIPRTHRRPRSAAILSGAPHFGRMSLFHNKPAMDALRSVDLVDFLGIHLLHGVGRKRSRKPAHGSRMRRCRRRRSFA